MSSPPLSGLGRPVSQRLRRVGRRLRQTLGSAVGVAGRPVRAAAFWSAVALPFLNLALLANGLSTTAETTAFLALLVTNAVALYVGQPYHRR
jgi:hypothetical protein